MKKQIIRIAGTVQNTFSNLSSSISKFLRKESNMATIPVSSGVTSNLILSSGDVLNVYNSGKVVSATVKKGATMNVYSGGSVYSTYVTSSAAPFSAEAARARP